MSPSLELKEYKFRVRVIKEEIVTIEDEDTIVGMSRAKVAAVEECCEHGVMVDWSVETV